jgi:signal transduction histidine kinase
MIQWGHLMLLQEFLKKHRDQILVDCEIRIVARAALLPTSVQMKKGLPIFFNQLIDALNTNLLKVRNRDEILISQSAATHGDELWKLGYTLSHVVHTYGAMCQAITGIAVLTKEPLTAEEFHKLNSCLDIAIAGAVTKFEMTSQENFKRKEEVNLGSFAHELRNALCRAQIAVEMLSKGLVGLGGSTSKVLARSLKDMDVLITRSLSEVRLRVKSELIEEYFLINGVINQLAITADIEAEAKNQSIHIQMEPNIHVNTDRHLVLAAIGNLIQNALKFTKEKGVIQISVKSEDKCAVIEVQDQCGGIPPVEMAKLFKAFNQQDTDKSGLGLGLIISKKAIEKCGGSLEVRNLSDGCVFAIQLPIAKPQNAAESKSIV